MWWIWLFLVQSSHARLFDVKDDYYYPNFDTDFPNFPPEVTAKRINDNYEFILTGESNFETYYVYGPEKKLDFDIEYDEATRDEAELKLEFDTASGVVVKFDLDLSNGYIVNTLVNNSTKIFCHGPEKKVPFYLNFETKTMSCGTLISPKKLPLSGLLNGQVFDTDKDTKIVPLAVSWKVRGTKMFWKFPAISMPFPNARRPNTTTLAPITTTTTTPKSITTKKRKRIKIDMTEAPKKQPWYAGISIWVYIVIALAILIMIASVILATVMITKRKAIAQNN